MLESHSARDPFGRVQLNKRCAKVKCEHVHLLDVVGQRLRLPLGESWLEVIELEGVFPVVLVGSS